MIGRYVENEVKYSIEDVEPIGDWLKIKSSEIFLNEKIDREIISEINMRVNFLLFICMWIY